MPQLCCPQNSNTVQILKNLAQRQLLNTPVVLHMRMAQISFYRALVTTVMP